MSALTAARVQLTPYLYFSGNAQDALDFYTASLGGTVSQLKRFGEYSGKPDEEWAQKIMFAQLEFGGSSMMISDTAKGKEVIFGSNIQMSISLKDEAEAVRLFTALSEGDSTVTMPLKKQFWGALFGILTDQARKHV